MIKIFQKLLRIVTVCSAYHAIRDRSQTLVNGVVKKRALKMADPLRGLWKRQKKEDFYFRVKFEFTLFSMGLTHIFHGKKGALIFFRYQLEGLKNLHEIFNLHLHPYVFVKGPWYISIAPHIILILQYANRKRYKQLEMLQFTNILAAFNKNCSQTNREEKSVLSRSISVRNAITIHWSFIHLNAAFKGILNVPSLMLGEHSFIGQVNLELTFAFYGHLPIYLFFFERRLFDSRINECGMGLLLVLVSLGLGKM